MALVFNPFTGNFDNVMASSSDMSFSGGSLNVNGDLTLDSGGAFTTTVQAVTPTANRTISFPDQTGTVGLVSGATGNIQYNNAGQLAGTGDLNVELDWPVTTTAYSGFKVNATDNGGNSNASTKLTDFQINGTSVASVAKDGAFVTHKNFVYAQPQFYNSTYGSNCGFQIVDNQTTCVYGNGNAVLAASNTSLGVRLQGTTLLGWVNGHALANVADVALARDSAGVVAVTDGSTGLGTLQGQLRAQGTAPTSSTDPGTIGDIRVAGTTLYVYNGSQWTRATLDTTAF